jgi:hypothetical protein
MHKKAGRRERGRREKSEREKKRYATRHRYLQLGVISNAVNINMVTEIFALQNDK